MIVVGLCVFLVLGGIVLSFATGGWGGPGSADGATGTTGAGLIHVKGSSLAGVSAVKALAVISSEGQPPADVADPLVVPAGATVTSHEDISGGLGTYDSAVFLSVAATPAQVVAFYRAEMPQRGWGLLPGGVTTAGQSQELFYEIASKQDSYYWQVAVTVTPVLPSLTPALGGGDQTAPTSRLELELVQVDDAD
jgi:hypothetical protein